MGRTLLCEQSVLTEESVLMSANCAYHRTARNSKCFWAKNLQEFQKLMAIPGNSCTEGDVIVLEDGQAVWGHMLQGVPICRPGAIDKEAFDIVRFQDRKPSGATSVTSALPNEAVRAVQAELQARDRKERQLREKYRPHTMLQFEVQLAEHCNLNCKGCDHFSPIAKPEFLDLEEYERDLSRLAELFDHECRYIYLLGGEPLLHPEVIRAMRLTRKYFHWGKVVMFTNGLLLAKMLEDFWQACKEDRIDIFVTKYPVKFDYEAVAHKAKDYGINFQFFNDTHVIKTLYRRPLSVAGDCSAADSFEQCTIANRCITLRHGRIYSCSVATHAHHLVTKYGLPLHESKRDSIDIYQAQTAEEIMAHCARPMPFCRYCKVSAGTHGEPYRQSRGDCYEWIDFEGNESDWEYFRQFNHIYVCTDGNTGGKVQFQGQVHGLDVRLLTKAEEISRLDDYGQSVAFLLCYMDKGKRREVQKILWAKKAANMILAS